MSPGSRGVLYDNCRDATRMAREWTIEGGGTWVVGYDATIGKFYYRCTTAGVSFYQLINKSIIFGMPIEVYCLMRSDFATGPRMGVEMKGGADTRGAFDVGVHLHSATIWLEASYNAVIGWDSVAMPLVWNINTWYNVKVRFDRFIKVKIWLYGTAEPNWSFVDYYRIPLPNGVLNYRSRVQKGYFALISNQSAGVINTDYADIRITPIPRTGGP